jgi:L-threonylcarbamoyladenylate synthase
MKTKIEKLDASNPDIGVLGKAARLIKKGGVIVCPTDTGYAFSADALNAQAIAKVFHLKGRSFANPIHIAVNSMAEAEKYARADESARHLAGRYLPGALTLVLPKTDLVPSILVAGLNTVGIRIPDNLIILRLVEICGVPLTTTSANISGRPTPYEVDEIISQLGENIQEVAMVLDQGPIRGRELSTIVDLSVNPPQLIRQGKISWLDIRDMLKIH